MPIVNAKDLLATGAHFGHRTSRWNPKMEPYILGKKNKIHIINLRETVRGIVAAYHYCSKRVSRLIELEGFDATGEINTYSKKMQSSLNREKRKIKRNLEGIRMMQKLPGALFIIDPRVEHNAVMEARRLSIPVIAMLDTD